MNILILGTYDIHGGAARAAYRLHLGLRAIGEGSRMMVGHKKSTDPDVLTLAPVGPEEAARAHAIHAAIEGDLRAYPAFDPQTSSAFHDDRSPVGEVLVRQMPAADVVNLHWVSGFVDGPSFLSSRRPGQPLVWTLHDMNAFTGGCHYAGGCRRFEDGCGACPVLGSQDPGDLSSRILRRRIAGLQAARTAGTRMHVVTPSRWLADEARRSALFRDVPVSTIPYGLETDIFTPTDRAEARRSFNLSPDLKLIVFVAHVVTDPRKGLALLDEALCRLGPQENLALLMVGLGTPALKAPVMQLKSGLVSDDATMSRLYSAADLVAVPSLEDNLPNTVLEAMASGTPVVGFRSGGIPDMIAPGENGFLAEPGDTASLAQAIGDAFSDPVRLAGMGRAARARIEREHTLAVQAGRYRELYQSLLQ